MTNPFKVFAYPGTITLQRKISSEYTDPNTGITVPATYDTETPLPDASLHTRSDSRTRFVVTIDTLPEETFNELFMVTDQIIDKDDLVIVYPNNELNSFTFRAKNIVTERPIFQSHLNMNRISYHLISTAPHTEPITDDTPTIEDPIGDDDDEEPGDDEEDTTTEDVPEDIDDTEDLSW
ncbi:hypothetical protein [Bacteroides sp.]|uniref:hypothetical protein n=1 Tax=Bacteroides sp. TaxID=29523 RepID=UPI00260D376F|nr:hypothetical protein [Bacteroides sp.]MDD3039017.1 hypothetical protein [Bacteroides sp.]